MQLTFVDDEVRRLCTSRELLMRVFGELWRSVAMLLSVLSHAETLADLAAFASLAVRRVMQTIDGLLEFDITHSAVQLRVRALESLSLVGDEQTLAGVKALSIVQVRRVAPVTAR